ncbi:Sodium/hydrogen exchanger 10, partial [Orchesella cincta]
ILLQTAGIVLLTLCVNGTTTKKLLEVLKLTEISPGRMEEMKNALKTINVSHKKALIMLRHDRFLSDANWTYVSEHTKIDDPYRNKIVADKSMPMQSSIVSIGPENVINECPGCHTFVPNQPTNEELKLMTEEARLRVIKAMKISFWAHFERGVLTEEAVQILAGTAETISDRVLYMIHARDLKKYWTIRGVFPWLRECIINHGGGKELEEAEVLPPKPKAVWKQRFWWLATRSWFDHLMTFLVLLNMVPAITQLVVESNYPICTPDYMKFFYTMTAANQAFALIYLLEFLVKIIGRGCSDYWSSKWNLLDFIVLIITFVDVALVAVFGCNDNSGSGALNFIKIFRIVRIFRGLKLLKNLIPAIMTGINGRINTQLFLGYDVALGYICACDDVLKFLPHMIDNKRVLHKIRSSVEKERLEAVREMGILQKNHPGIAIAVKTRHASRSVLNHMKSTLNELRVDGLLDEKENDLLTIVLEERMKRLWNSPSYIAPPAPEVLLANLNWLYGHDELRDHIFKNATLLQYEVNDVIASTGDPPQGIYVIVSGMIRIDYEPLPDIVEDRAAYGVIPVMEIFKSLDFDKKITDYFSSGTVIGEASCLTGRLRAASVICETEGVSAYHIPLSVMKEALETFTDHFDSLEERLWRACGMRRAANYLTTLSSYHTIPKEKLEMLLERSCVPIGPEFETIRIPPYIQDVVVIEGMAKSADTGELFIAPAVIPKSCTKIRMPDNPKTSNRVLVFLQEDKKPDEDDEDALARCLIAANKQRRHSMPEEKLTDDEKPVAAPMSIKKQRRLSVAVNFGVRQKGKRSSINGIRRSSVYTTGSSIGTVETGQSERVLRRNVRRKSTAEAGINEEKK